MKAIIKHVALIFTLIIVFAGVSSAQEQVKAPYLVSARSKSNNVHGRLVAINDTALVILNKKNAIQYLAFDKITFIRVDKNRSDVGFGVLTAAAVAGNIALAVSIDDAFTAILVGTAGTVGIVAIMSVIHNLVHPAVLKLNDKAGAFTHNELVKQLTPYISQTSSAP